MTEKDIRSALRHGGRLEVWISEHGLQVTLRGPNNKSRGSVEPELLQRFLDGASGPALQAKRKYERAARLLASPDSLEARVAALEQGLRSGSTPQVVDQPLNDIALALTGKPFQKLGQAEQDAVRQIAARTVVSNGAS